MAVDTPQRRGGPPLADEEPGKAGRGRSRLFNLLEPSPRVPQLQDRRGEASNLPPPSAPSQPRGPPASPGLLVTSDRALTHGRGSSTADEPPEDPWALAAPDPSHRHPTSSSTASPSPSPSPPVAFVPVPIPPQHRHQPHARSGGNTASSRAGANRNARLAAGGRGAPGPTTAAAAAADVWVDSDNPGSFPDLLAYMAHREAVAAAARKRPKLLLPDPPASQQQRAPARDTAASTPMTPMDAGSWGAVARSHFADVYDPTWHDTLFEFCFDLWPAVGEAHARRSAEASGDRPGGSSGQARLDATLPARAYRFLQLCCEGPGHVSAVAMVSFMAEVANSDALLCGAADLLPEQLLLGSVLPLMGQFHPADYVDFYGLVRDRFPGAPEPEEVPGRWQPVLRRLAWLRQVHPQVDVSLLVMLDEEEGQQ